MTREEQRGGQFLIDETDPGHIFTPEDLSPEQQTLAAVTDAFIEQEVLPVLAEIEEQQWEYTLSILNQVAELGFLGVDVPTKYGGLGLDAITSTVITEHFASARSLAISYGAHVGIGTLPIVYFGNENQKQRYLPALASGTQWAAYALTEPGSGSDALGAKTIARLSPCGKYYLLSGEKQWITNAGFADVLIVYAQVEGKHFTAFIVEKGFAGVSTGPEEKKMGITGTSTRSILLDEARVPVENILGEIGKGHIIAFQILNIGRYKLAAGCVGSCKRVIALSVEYATLRRQFQTPIANFNLIKAKLADMAILTYAAESMVYRTGGLISVENDRSTVAQSSAEYAIECSINKIFTSEALDQVIDEGVQIHGGSGYMRAYEVEQIYRDSRINRIFEGTNEINRLLIVETLLKRTLTGRLDLASASQGLLDELIAWTPAEPNHDQPFETEKQHLDISKKLFLMMAGLLMHKDPKQLEYEQELLANMADMVTEIYAMESALLRAKKSLDGHMKREQLHRAYTQIYVQEGFERMASLVHETLATMETGDRLRTMLALLRKLTRYQPLNTVIIKRKIADCLIEAGGYLE